MNLPLYSPTAPAAGEKPGYEAKALWVQSHTSPKVPPPGRGATARNTSSSGVRTFAIAIDRITAPLYRPIRRLLPDFGGIDFSPLVILILIQVIKKLLAGVVTQYYGM